MKRGNKRNLKIRGFREVLSLIRALLPQRGLFISIKDPETGGKMVIIRKMEKPKVHFAKVSWN